MGGTRAGGLKASQTMKRRYGKDVYQDIGRKGGKSPKTKPAGFAAHSHEQVVEWGRQGGTKSRKSPSEEVRKKQSEGMKRFWRGLVR